MARFFSEARLLQREVKVLLEGVSNQLALGTILHPVSATPPPPSPLTHTRSSAPSCCVVDCSARSQAGNISELLLKEGFARCVDWSMAVVTTGREKLRAAEKYAYYY